MVRIERKERRKEGNKAMCIKRDSVGTDMLF
jgi:hypothetical protein